MELILKTANDKKITTEHKETKDSKKLTEKPEEPA